MIGCRWVARTMVSSGCSTRLTYRIARNPTFPPPAGNLPVPRGRRNAVYANEQICLLVASEERGRPGRMRAGRPRFMLASPPMNTLALKLTVTPVLILAASLASRRWGEAVGGWFIGLPLTSGPVCFFLALDQGVGFAAAAGVGCLAGAAAEAGFCIAFARIAPRHGWPPAMAAGSVAFFAGVAALDRAALPLWPLVGLV